jgi:4-amino-4-deoxy-L-arabinose transferase-like glycosyltransferase
MVVLALLALLGYVWVATPRTIVYQEEPAHRAPLHGLGRIWRFWQKHLPQTTKIWPLISAVVLVGTYLIGRLSSDQPKKALRPVALLAVLALGVEGQLLLLNRKLSTASILYGAALLGFIAWLIIYRPKPRKEPPATSRIGRTEAGLLILILALTVFARFYALSRVPYGIEGDESKWTLEVVSVMLDGRHTIQSEYHYGTEPTSFYMQAPFHHLLGPGIVSARVAVATYSVLASLAFYWLLRETLGPPEALLATALLAVSLVDVSASRMALVEGHVKLWAVAGLAFLSHGLRVQRPIHSCLGGAALAIGLLTYDTFAPMVAVAVIWAGLTLAVQRASPKAWVSHLTALLLPILVVMPGVAEYLMGRRGYYDVGRLGWQTAPLAVLRDNVGMVIQNAWEQTYGDFLFVRSGPIMNSFLIPLLAIGLVLALARIRKPGYALPALWFALLFFPVPIYTGTPGVRVFYPGFPAIYALVALAMVLIWRETRAALPVAARPALRAAAGLILVGLALTNLYLYFNDLEDPVDRRIRRELSDTVTQAVAPDRRVYVPYFPNSGDAIEFEQELFFLAARRKLPRDQLEEHIWVGTYSDLLHTLFQEQPYFDSVAFVINHSLPERADEQAPFLGAIQRCLGARLEREGEWFDLYVADGFDAQAAICAAPRVHLSFHAGSPPQPGQPVRFDWWSEDTAGQGEARLACEKLRPDTVAVEAEDMEHDDGWHEDQRFVSGFRGQGYLADRTTLGNAHVTVTLPSPGTYTLWARVYRRSSDPHPFILSVSDQSRTFTWTSGHPPSRWIWLEMPNIELGRGVHTVHMARPIQEPAPGTLALFVDTIILSADRTFDPREDSEWLPFIDLQKDIAPNTSSGTFEHSGFPAGTYRCWVTLLDDGRLLDQSAHAGATSDRLAFDVLAEE